jgi:signal transduction histidine kinase
VLGNQNDLIIVLRNLVENSIKYSKEEGGKVIISADEDESHVYIRVTDNGIGIRKEYLPTIFDGMRTPDIIINEDEPRGLGFGIPIVKNLVEIHGGKVSISSELGEGTTVFLELPKSKLS